MLLVMKIRLTYTEKQGFPGACQCRLHITTQVWPLGQEGPLEESKATHSSILAWEIPWTEEPGGLQSMQSQSWTRLKLLGAHAQREVAQDSGHDAASEFQLDSVGSDNGFSCDLGQAT